MVPLNQVGDSRLYHRANLLLRSYPQSAVSDDGRRAAAEYLASKSERSAYLLEALPGELFVPYVGPLLGKTGWSPAAWNDVMQSVSVIESMYGCVHGCEMCYIDAPPPQVSMPWTHVAEVLRQVADARRAILHSEVREVLVNDVLRSRLTPFSPVIDALLSLVRHARNRFANYSDHLICYWKSNPTNWSDPLHGFDYADICNAVVKAFQLYQQDELLRLVDGDRRSYARFKQDLGEDPRRLLFATSVHAITSTVPFASGSLGDRAVRRILIDNPLGSEMVRVSIPHPALIRTGRANPERYWAAVQHSLRTAEPKLVYLFATSVDQLLDLVEHVQATFDRSERPWWIESRLALYEIVSGRKRSEPDEVIIDRLRRVLKRLSFFGRLEGKGKQFVGNPFYTEGSVMCVNGVVLAPDRRLHYQACTDREGADLHEGAIFEDIHGLNEVELLSLIRGHPLTNRARELVTPGLAAIPLRERRKPWNWFQQTTITNRADARYKETLDAIAPLAARVVAALRL